MRQLRLIGGLRVLEDRNGRIAGAGEGTNLGGDTPVAQGRGHEVTGGRHDRQDGYGGRGNRRQHQVAQPARRVFGARRMYRFRGALSLGVGFGATRRLLRTLGGAQAGNKRTPGRNDIKRHQK